MKKTLFFLLFSLPIAIVSFSQQPNIDSLINIVTTAKDDTGKVIAYRMLTGLSQNTNPSKAVAYGKAGVLLGKKIGFDKGVAGCFLNIAGSYSAAGKLDSALLYADTAILWSAKVGEPGRLALAYLNKADYQRQIANYTQALKNCDTSMVYAEKANKDDTKARIYQTIGSVYHAQDNFEQSKLYYEKGYQLYEKGSNKKMMAISMSNLGNVFKHLKKYELAVASFQNAIRLAEEIGDKNNMAMYYSNMSDVYVEKGDLQAAQSSAVKSLDLARKQENDLQIMQSQLVLSGIYLKKGNIKEAIRSASEGFSLIDSTDMLGEKQIVADVLAEAYFKDGNYKEGYKYMAISKSLTDSLAKEKYNNEVTSMQTKFKVDEKNKEILLLAKDKELQQQQIKEQRYLMMGIATIVLLSFIGIWQFINRNRLRQRMKELELRNQIAADLHDEVGSSLSSIHLLSQMATQPGNEATQKNILERMSSNAKETMDKMGDLVWTIKPEEAEGRNLKQRMELFTYEMCSAKNIEASLELDKLDTKDLTMEQRKNIYLIFKEALNNAVKYSGAEKIFISAANGQNMLTMIVKDEGKGFDSELIKKGNGLYNIQNRAKGMGGHVEIYSKPGNGTEVKLTMQLKK